MNFNLIHEKHCESFVRVAFEGDSELFERYHVIKNDPEAAIKDTVQKIKDAQLECPVKYYFYGIDYTGEKIGYYSMYQSGKKCILHSFGLNITYRTEENLKALIDDIDKKANGSEISCILRSDNKRAIAFLQKHGFVFLRELAITEPVNGVNTECFVTILNK